MTALDSGWLPEQSKEDGVRVYGEEWRGSEEGSSEDEVFSRLNSLSESEDGVVGGKAVSGRARAPEVGADYTLAQLETFGEGTGWNAGIFDVWCNSLDGVVMDVAAERGRGYQRSRSVCAGMEASRTCGSPRGRVGKRVGAARRGSCSALYEVGAGHHPAVYKYVAQAQLSMQCDATKVPMENKAEWLGVSRMTTERAAGIVGKLGEKQVQLETAYEVFELFPGQRFLAEKLELLALEFEPFFAGQRSVEETAALMTGNARALNRWVWLDQRGKRAAGQLKQFPRLTVREGAGMEPYEIEVRTSSGYNDFTAAGALGRLDFVLMRLRHMNLLRESDDRKRKTKYYEFIEGKMKRPLNSFMLYRSALMKALAILKVAKMMTDVAREVQQELGVDEGAALTLLREAVLRRRGMAYEESPHLERLSNILDAQLYRRSEVRGERVPVDPKFSNHTVLAQVITLMWNSESHACRERFVAFSKVEKNHHHLVYPKYKYCPVKKLKLEELEHNLNITTFSSDLFDGFKSANG